MKLRTALALALAPPLMACPGPITSPGQVADQTVLDEKAGIAIETAYTAAARAGALAIRARLVTPAQAQRIAALDSQAYAVVLRSRAAYAAGNAADYDAAVREADRLIRQLISQTGDDQ